MLFSFAAREVIFFNKMRIRGTLCGEVGTVDHYHRFSIVWGAVGGIFCGFTACGDDLVARDKDISWGST